MEHSFVLFRGQETINLSDIVEMNVTWVDRCTGCLEGLVKCITCSRRPIRSMEIFKNTACVFNQVDMWSRRLFPLSFLMINFLYWSFYVYIMQNNIINEILHFNLCVKNCFCFSDKGITCHSRQAPFLAKIQNCINKKSGMEILLLSKFLVM